MTLSKLPTNLQKVRQKSYEVSGDQELVKDIVESVNELYNSGTNNIIALGERIDVVEQAISDTNGDVSDLITDMGTAQGDILNLQAIPHASLLNLDTSVSASTTDTTFNLYSAYNSTALFRANKMDGLTVFATLKSTALDTWDIKFLGNTLMSLAAPAPADSELYEFTLTIKRATLSAGYTFMTHVKIIKSTVTGGVITHVGTIRDGYLIDGDCIPLTTTLTAVNNLLLITLKADYTGAGTPTSGELSCSYRHVETNPLQNG